MSTSRRPNVLVIMSDEQSYDTMGCTGNPAAMTPHLDALAERGRVSDRLYTPFPLCCPSRTSLMTGLMPRHHHVLGNWRGIRPESILWIRDSEHAHGEHCDPAEFRAGRDSINLSVTDHDYRYIFRSEDTDELFDRRTDPGEITNLAAARPEIVDTYRKLLRHEVSDVFKDPFSSSKGAGQ